MDDFYTSFFKKTTIMTGQEKKKLDSLPIFRGVFRDGWNFMVGG
jgi:hypothetical protein